MPVAALQGLLISNNRSPEIRNIERDVVGIHINLCQDVPFVRIQGIFTLTEHLRNTISHGIDHPATEYDAHELSGIQLATFMLFLLVIISA